MSLTDFVYRLARRIGRIRAGWSRGMYAGLNDWKPKK